MGEGRHITSFGVSFGLGILEVLYYLLLPLPLTEVSVSVFVIRKIILGTDKIDHLPGNSALNYDIIMSQYQNGIRSGTSILSSGSRNP